MAEFRAEYAKSNRSSCRGCHSTISKEELRLAKMIKSPHFDGLQPLWYHVRCFFGSSGAAAGIVAATQLDGYELLRPEDQTMLRNCVKGKPASGGSASAVAANQGPRSDLSMEYAKSSRSTCRACSQKIEKGELRLGIVMLTEEYQPTWWYHRKCFADVAIKAHDNIDLSIIQPQHFGGHNSIDADLIQDVQNLFDSARTRVGMKPAPAVEEPEGKTRARSKRKAADSGGKAKRNKKAVAVAVSTEAEPDAEDEDETEEQKALKKQTRDMWALKDKLKSCCNTGMLREMLDENGQSSRGGESRLLDHVVDGMLFGRLMPCSVCKEMRWHYTAKGYECNGSVSEWEPCTVVTRGPPRSSWKLTAAVKGTDEFAKWKFVKRTRLFPPEAEVDKAHELNAKALDASSLSAAPAEPDGPPLAGHAIATVGRLSISLAKFKELLTKLGATYHTGSIGSHVLCLITTQSTIDKGGKKIQEARKFGVPMVSLDFLSECEEKNDCVLMEPHVLECSSTVIEPSQAKKHEKQLKNRTRWVGADEEEQVTETGETVSKVIVKGRAAVDTASGVAETHHVLEDGDLVWNASLSSTDLRRGINSFYKLQILVPDTGKGSGTYLFRQWGRVGTTQGGKMLQAMPLSSARSSFKALFSEKTGGNEFGRKPYTKYPGFFYPLDVDYGDALKKSSVARGSKTALDSRVVDLINLIFDVDTMKKTMQEMEIDLTKMPLGKLSRSHLEAALGVLNNLATLLDNGGLDDDARKRKTLAASNQFYTMIPHDFGLKQPPLIDNKEMIIAKTRLIEDLLDMEIAARLLETGDGDEEDPVDVYYKKLNTDIEPVDKDSDEFAMIQTYVKNTHAKTHTMYQLEVEDAFVIRRHGEDEKFKKFAKLPNHQLLWHGSRLTNYCGILSEGLRIAPPSAPVTGYMFGKGVYFADMVTKSANYCRTSPSSNTGIMLLAEVALGDMYERVHADYINKLPKGKHSTFGMGGTRPDPKATVTLDDGVKVPLGKGVPSGVRGSLLYNEYIVYDTAQIRLRYLLRMKFKYGKSSW